MQRICGLLSRSPPFLTSTNIKSPLSLYRNISGSPVPERRTGSAAWRRLKRWRSPTGIISSTFKRLGRIIWFPRFYKNDEWQTWISDDEETIFERRIVDNHVYLEGCLNRPEAFKRLVFAAVGPGKYRFKGLYEIDARISRSTSLVTYRRKATRVRTYAPAKLNRSRGLTCFHLNKES
jgi:hypothetical protein